MKEFVNDSQNPPSVIEAITDYNPFMPNILLCSSLYGVPMETTNSTIFVEFFNGSCSGVYLDGTVMEGCTDILEGSYKLMTLQEGNNSRSCVAVENIPGYAVDDDVLYPTGLEVQLDISLANKSAFRMLGVEAFAFDIPIPDNLKTILHKQEWSHRPRI